MTTIDMKYFSFGDIVLLKFPYTNEKKYKKRPALIIFDTRDGDIIVCRITSKLYETKFDFLVEDWKESGLKLPSVVRLHKIATLEKSLIDQKIGKTSQKLKDTIKIKFNKLIE
jgi:mRNA interferase MazF